MDIKSSICHHKLAVNKSLKGDSHVHVELLAKARNISFEDVPKERRLFSDVMKDFYNVLLMHFIYYIKAPHDWVNQVPD